ncbi:DUF1850 domain-containing protein [Serpentinicella sp. ANB-PHB4]|uniref:DUF1850 domain-containing protein n=1 Tax=Serpentinicella sp. ANB-PHB4 TaxID=3074076 RepID=UPI002859E817|nr:DUF1850 domain-containing protein [Serpentinicella sp. ANB-PHB4]MDR5659081.1 DUF1850 domain-containing protein [Serpentinicella sp. ANB-PHB4]
MKLTSKLFKNGHRYFRCPLSLITIVSTIVIFLMLLVYFFGPIYYGISVKTAEGQVLINYKLEPKSEIYIDYTHSVARSNVRDVFELNDDFTFTLTRTEYEAFGAGLPTEKYESFELIDGRYINKGINIVLKEIPLRIGKIAKHKLSFEDEVVFDLLDYIEAGELVIIEPSKLTRWKIRQQRRTEFEK